MICFVKNIIAAFYLFLCRRMLNVKSNIQENNLLLINTEKLGDIVVSSSFLEFKNLFKEFDNVYFMISDQYVGLLRGYSGDIKIIGFCKRKFVRSIFYNIKVLKFVYSLNISEVYNISQARGWTNELLTHVNKSAKRYTTNNSSDYLGSIFINYWNAKYERVLFGNIKNEYLKTEKLIYRFSGKISKEKDDLFSKLKPSKYSGIDVISISPYASESIKNWNVEKYREVILNFNSNYKIIVLCSEKQKNQAQIDFGGLYNVIISDADLFSTVSIIKDSVVFIGNDSGLTHLSAKIGTKTIGLIGGGMYSKYYPIPYSKNIFPIINKLDCYDCNWVCIHKTPLCLTEISSVRIVAQLVSIFNL